MRGQVDYKDGVRFMGIPLAPYYSAEYGLYAYYAGENGTIWSEKEQKFLEPILTPSGYYRIRLKYKSYKVHFLMAYTFFDVFRLNPQMDVHHIDRNKTNNALNNILPVMRDEHEVIHGRKIF